MKAATAQGAVAQAATPPAAATPTALTAKVVTTATAIAAENNLVSAHVVEPQHDVRRRLPISTGDGQRADGAAVRQNLRYSVISHKNAYQLLFLFSNLSPDRPVVHGVQVDSAAKVRLGDGAARGHLRFFCSRLKKYEGRMSVLAL